MPLDTYSTKNASYVPNRLHLVKRLAHAADTTPVTKPKFSILFFTFEGLSENSRPNASLRAHPFATIKIGTTTERQRSLFGMFNDVMDYNV